MIGSVGFHRILRSDHHKRLFQLIGDAIDADLVLLHDLQQGGLRLGGGTIDLICQQNIAECCSPLELPLAVQTLQHMETGDIRRHNIRCHLNSGEGSPTGCCQRCCQLCLADPRHILHQHMPLRQQCGEQCHRN